MEDSNKVMRNGICPCGSGRRYKRCCGYAVHNGMAEQAAASETPETGVPEQIYRLLETGLAYYKSGDSAKALEYYEAGIALANRFPQDSENSSSAREDILVLYLNAGVRYANSGNSAKVLEHYEAGIALANRFPQDWENSSGALKNILGLYRNAGILYINSGNSAKALEHYEAEIALANRFPQDWENSSGAREDILVLYYNAGYLYINSGNSAKALEHYEAGIDLANRFPQDWEDSSGAREKILGLYNNAGYLYKNSGNSAKALEYYEAGIDLANRFPQDWENSSSAREHMFRDRISPGVLKNSSSAREHILSLYSNAVQTYFDDGQHWAALSYFFCFHYLSWEPPTSKSQQSLLRLFPQRLSDQLYPTGRSADSSPTGDDLPLAFLHLWHNFLRQWVGLHGRPDQVQNPEQADEIARVCEALIVYDLARQNQPFQALLQRHTDLDEQMHHLLSRAASAAAAKGHSIIRKILDWLFPIKTRRNEKGPPEPMAKQVWEEIKPVLEKQADWLAMGLLGRDGLLPAWTGAEDILLAILFASQPESPDDIAGQWLQNPPWEDEETLRAAMEKTGWREWKIYADGERAPLSAWLWSLPPPAERIDWGMEKRAGLDWAGPELDKMLSKYAGQDIENVATVADSLRHAFRSAAERGEKLAKILAELAGPACVPALGHRALAAVILHRTVAMTQEAIHAWLDRSYPLGPQDTVREARSTLKQRFSAIIHRHPGPALQGELAKKLHDWSGRTIQLALAGSPDPVLIWNSLEQAQVALNGLKAAIPENARDWEYETVKELLAVMPLRPEEEEKSPWPLPLVWRLCLEEKGIVPAIPTPEDCRERLGEDEVLVQLFFAPESGKMHGLLLDRTNPLTLFTIETPELVTTSDHCGQTTLCQWDEWLDKGSKENRPFEPVWAGLAESPLVRGVEEKLLEILHNAKAARLVTLFSAPLAQLPWEALFRKLPPGSFERAVSLHAWRRERDDQAGGENARVFFDPDPKSLRFGLKEARQSSDYLKSFAADGCCPVEKDWKPNCFDVINGLRRAKTCHLIFHGAYNKDTPFESGLKLDQDNFAHLWSLSVGGVGTRDFLGLSSCQANLSGIATKDLLGPVGIGPSLVAAGARMVIGPLWNVNQLSNWVFYHVLFREAGKDARAPWSQLLERARKALREYTREELDEFCKKLSAKEEGNIKYDYLLKLRKSNLPFASPYYWAAYILLGDGERILAEPVVMKS